MTRFLVIDDHAAQRFLICDLLRTIGFEKITEAASASAALATICQSDAEVFDVLVCDLQMPDMDGIGLIRMLDARGIKPSALILMSSYDHRILQAAEMAAKESQWQVLGCVQKPVSGADLQRLLTMESRSLAQSAQLPMPVYLSSDEIWDCLCKGQFIAHYQPKFNLDTMKYIGAELLARCDHPHYGLLSPASFRELFDDPDALRQLTWQMLHQGLKDLQRWHAQGLCVSLAFNLGWPLLKQHDFATVMIEETRRRGINPASIIIEVTETEELSDLPLVLGNMASLRLHGFQLALDDFGSGYANLQLLSQMPLTQLKLDQSLLRAASRGRDGLTVLAAAVGMAKSLAVTDVVLEGIESTLDLDIARQLDISTGQGYFLARPMSAVEIGNRF